MPAITPTTNSGSDATSRTPSRKENCIGGLVRIYDCERIIVSYALDCDPKDVVRGVTTTDLAIVVRLFILMLRTYVKELQR
jgi:hypothetical protein